MKPHPKIRKTVKWAGAVVSVLLIAAWIASYRGEAGWFGGGGTFVTIIHGRLHFGQEMALSPPRDWFAVRLRPLFNWRFDWGTNQWGHWGVDIPLWSVILFTVTLTTALWHRDGRVGRRMRAGRCVKCGYDRCGIPPLAICPECGDGPTVDAVLAFGTTPTPHSPSVE